MNNISLSNGQLWHSSDTSTMFYMLDYIGPLGLVLFIHYPTNEQQQTIYDGTLSAVDMATMHGYIKGGNFKLIN